MELQDDMMDIYEFNYMDHMPDYSTLEGHFAAEGVTLSEDCYNWMMTVDLMYMDDYMMDEMSQNCGWDNDTMETAGMIFYDWVFGLMDEHGGDWEDEFMYQDYMPSFDGAVEYFASYDVDMSEDCFNWLSD